MILTTRFNKMVNRRLRIIEARMGINNLKLPVSILIVPGKSLRSMYLFRTMKIIPIATRNPPITIMNFPICPMMFIIYTSINYMD